ncbi:hypothetical protein LK482_05970 [Ruminococcus callidus]|jgi:hypothetical protein|uniref:hypothetical protein n=1 Tax=Ruminococcus callidus TaxID=40519 RepID=UPI001D00FD22|nr:hypothetical protein [Ruminococcus callidus]MCB5774970.1 hypothetical protein [Ruminococcus callidus]MCC2758956.1 hypothetical protein [Ruminococcus callidus]
MIQKIIPIAASITLIGSASLTAYADNMLDKDYIVREIWSDWWHGKGDDGLIFPEASYKHHILTDWVNDNYGNDNYDWSKIGQLNYNFKDYYDELTDNWNFNDDRDGNWTIITDETTYHFNLQNGKWLMSDDNGNVIDSFMPFSTLTEDAGEVKYNSVTADNGNGTAHRVGENLKIDDDTTVDISEEATASTSEKKTQMV